MPSLKDIRKRIGSVQSTQKITKAMKMVAAAKLRRAQDRAIAARPYAEKLTDMLTNVASRVTDSENPLLVPRDEVNTIHLILVTADRGLCGGYNTNLIRKAAQFIAEHGADRVKLVCVGRRGFDYFKKRAVEIDGQHINLFGGPDHSLADELSARFRREYAVGESDAVYVLYNEFRSALVQEPTVRQILPMQAPADEQEEASTTEYLYEPAADELLGRLVSQYVTVLIHRAFLEAIASEHGARMTAMDSATSNASDMIDKLTLEMNRARQATVTTELMEIVGGAEALNG